MKSLSGLKNSQHLFLLTWLLAQQVTGLTEPPKLDMAPDAFDDQYEGCVEEMEKKAPELLKKDFNMSRWLKLEWEKAEQKWKTIKNRMSYPKGFHDLHGTALVTYTGDIHNNFNGAVREFRKNPSNFHYRAFHYYLTRALQLLSNQNCYSVYRGTKDRFHYSESGSVRFGQFASSSLNKEVALKTFSGATGTLYTIKTCLGVYIKAFSYYPSEEEVLIPAYEVYHKVSVTQSGKEIFLDSPRREKSNFNCFYSGHLNSSGARDGCAFLLLVVLPGLLVYRSQRRLCLPAACSATWTPGLAASSC